MTHPFDYKLCYVDPDNNVAYFVDEPIDDVWGDDWDDAHYEYNAGAPYVNKPHTQILLPLVSEVEEFYQPKDQLSLAGYSVEQINTRCIPWIHMENYNPRREGGNMNVYGGDDLKSVLKEFKRFGLPIHLSEDVWDRINEEGTDLATQLQEVENTDEDFDYTCPDRGTLFDTVDENGVVDRYYALGNDQVLLLNRVDTFIPYLSSGNLEDHLFDWQFVVKSYRDNGDSFTVFPVILGWEEADGNR